MRGLKSTIALLVILIGLGAYIFFVERDREIEDPNAKPKAYATLNVDQIEEVQVRNASGETTRVQKIGDDWQIVEPVKADADDGVVGTVTSNVGTLEVQRVVDENPGDLAQYGLNPARIEVGFRLKDQKDFQRLLVGDKTPTGGDLFAKRADENRVFLVSSFLDSIFNKTPFELRDKVVLKFDRDKAEGIEVTTGSNTVQFTRNGTDWRIVKPIAARADYATTEGLLTRLSSTNMLKVVNEDGGDLAMYGLDRPTATASALIGSSRASLLIGRMSDDGGFYAKDSSRPMVFTVEQALVTDLQKNIVEFRRKDLFDARSFSANRVELRRGDATTTLEKTETGGQAAWKTASGQMETAKVEDALTKLSSLRADAFEPAAHASLKSPVLAVTIRFDDNKTETVTFGRTGNDVYASRGDEPGAARVMSALFDEAMKAADALR
jgi:hypothetical protein